MCNSHATKLKLDRINWLVEFWKKHSSQALLCWTQQDVFSHPQGLRQQIAASGLHALIGGLTRRR